MTPISSGSGRDAANSPATHRRQDPPDSAAGTGWGWRSSRPCRRVLAHRRWGRCTPQAMVRWQRKAEAARTAPLSGRADHVPLRPERRRIVRNALIFAPTPRPGVSVRRRSVVWRCSWLHSARSALRLSCVLPFVPLPHLLRLTRLRRRVGRPQRWSRQCCVGCQIAGDLLSPFSMNLRAAAS